MRSTKSRMLPGVATLACLATALVGGSAPALADGTAGPPLKGRPDAADIHRTASCNLAPSADRSRRHEFASCLSVGASLDRLPAVGETARLTLTVRSDVAVSDADIEVELPPNLTWQTVPSGLVADTVRSRAPETRGALAAASARHDLAAHETTTFTGVVRATAAGAAQVRASATAFVDGSTQVGADDVFLTVGETSSVAGIVGRSGKNEVTVTDVPAGAEVSSTPRAKFRRAALPERALPKASAPCDTRVAGRWVYQDQTGAWRSAPNIQVQVWDADVFGDDHLATGITDAAGNYNICFDSQSEGFPDGGTADVYVRFIAENAIWRVQRGGSPWSWRTGTTNDVATGSTLNLGSLTTDDAALHRGLHAFDEANDAWLWIPKPRNSCFDQDDNACRQLRINWAPDSTDGTFYSRGDKEVHLVADDPNSQILVLHEVGHALMDDIYNDAYPATPNCNPHSITGTSSAGCAWSEGWAEWFPSTVYNDPFFRWPGGQSLNLENQGWADGRADGDTTEGRVAGALIDLTDGVNEAPWDRVTEGRNPIWNTFMANVSGTMAQFWVHRAAGGHNVGSSARSTLFNNTIDYGFRDPMANYVQLHRPNPVVPHNYSYGTNTLYWSVVGVRPQAGTDIDLRLYDDFGQTVLLKLSAASGSTTDFVAVDSNRRPFGGYYPRNYLFNGSGGYTTELAQGSSQLPVGSRPLAMGSGDVVAVRDMFLTRGVPTTIRVRPGNATQDAEAFLMRSTAASSTWVRSRAEAAVTASSRGPGGVESFTYTPPATGWYGLVVVNKAGSGTYTLQRSEPRSALSSAAPRK